jgi:hypothetical protein
MAEDEFPRNLENSNHSQNHYGIVSAVLQAERRGLDVLGITILKLFVQVRYPLEALFASFGDRIFFFF